MKCREIFTHTIFSHLYLTLIYWNGPLNNATRNRIYLIRIEKNQGHGIWFNVLNIDTVIGTLTYVSVGHLYKT